ncbi:MAG: hypothetical protein JSS89_05925 [Bacteroidetes bacterium]|nr:hypothetical protein [Bacteroidota bacterium]
MQLLLTTGSIRGLEDLRAWFFTWGYERSVTSYDPSGKDASANVDDWMEVLGSSVRRKDVETILYGTAPEEFFAVMYGGSGPSRYSDNSFITYVLKPENVHVLNYILLAKEMERLELSSTWVYNLEQHYTTVRGLLEKGLSKRMPTWLRQRYIYQWLRAYPVDSNVVWLLDREIGHGKSSSTIHRWILLRYAQALNAVHRPVDANLALCEVFDRCPSKRRRALQLFNTDTAALEQTFARASRKERVLLLTMVAMRDPSSRMVDVRRVYRLDRTSRYWLFLATRELNKIEDYLSGPGWEERRTLEPHRVRELESFLASTLPTGNAEWNCHIGLMLAQCATLRHAHDAAYRRLMSIKYRPTPALEYQYSTILAFHYISTDRIHSRDDAERLASLLKALNHEPEASCDTSSKRVVSSLAQLASGAYAKRGSFAMAALFSTFGPTGWWSGPWESVMTSTTLKEILSILQGDTLPNVHELLKSSIPSSLQSIHQLLSLAYCAEGRFAEAAASARVCENAPAFGDTFISDINELDPFYPRWVGRRRTVIKRWKASVLYDSLARLERMAIVKNVTARTLLDRAHALYSISYFGSAWYLSRSSRSDEMHSGRAVPYWPSLFYSSLPPMSVTSTYNGSNKDYYLLERSINAYQRAREAASSTEERSEAEFMLALCEENRSAFLQDAPVQFSHQWPTKKNDHAAFRTYYRRYGNTEFAKRSFCPLLAEYTHWSYARR